MTDYIGDDSMIGVLMILDLMLFLWIPICFSSFSIYYFIKHSRTNKFLLFCCLPGFIFIIEFISINFGLNSLLLSFGLFEYSVAGLYVYFIMILSYGYFKE
ncbi:hypothetical protein [Enterococcus mundtii]|uniref:hypothetical protein n=1 Tax=Enterococcus mundtii TaxID=53346 RepID=UPI002DBFB62C|nr:hypothetical protein [Enterococcus mundtii]MEC3942744.1 hypothetical protein [Enterococcus mundtii]